MLALKERLRSHLQEIVRERDAYLATQGHFYVQQYIRQAFSQWGTVESHQFLVGAKTHSNWVLNLPAQNQAIRSVILIGAHYDTVPGSPGADDNATGSCGAARNSEGFSCRTCSISNSIGGV